VKIAITDNQRDVKPDRPLIRKLIRLAGKGVWDKAELSVVIVGHEEMVALNRNFTGRDGDTDVLAFPMDDDMPEGGVAGEIIVCASRAAREAHAREVEAGEELLLYVVHGAVHLLGYDDHSPEDRKEMYAREDEILVQAEVRNVRKLARKRRIARSPANPHK
jgi:probable rRNA maturation factor